MEPKPTEKPESPAAWLKARLDRGETIDLRGDGKAGGGLVLAIQAFGTAVTMCEGLDVQNWPHFSSARKGANVRAFLRVGRGRIETACQVTRPDVAVLMSDAAGEEVDFAEGTERAAFILNTPRSPEEAAARHRLGGAVATVSGDALGRKHLSRPLGNVAVFAALTRVTELVDRSLAKESLKETLAKRRLPERIVDANLALFDDAFEQVRVAHFPRSEATEHPRRVFKGYQALPLAAQSALRTSRKNMTAGYGRPGVKIEFEDPSAKCNGCSLCVVQCPEGIIDFKKDPAKGAIVYGARFDDYCKGCRECIVACPLDLFREVPAVAPPEGKLAGT